MNLTLWTAAGRRRFSYLLAFVACSLSAQTGDFWFPGQSLPKTVVVVNSPDNRAGLMTLQSLAGLAAQAVNEKRGDELVWVDDGNPNINIWRTNFLAAHPDVHLATSDLWTLLGRYADGRFVKGYILYKSDSSLAVATSLAGILGGVIVDEQMQPAAQAHGLKLLLDARDKSPSWCFESYKGRFNRRLICLQDPTKPHLRDLAIAQRVFTDYGADATIRRVVEWIDPLSAALGWNGGDEFGNTDLLTRFGDFQTGTDWCMDLTVTMAGAEAVQPMKIPPFPGIAWSDRRSGVCFIDTDGDNSEWWIGNFVRNTNYWADPRRGAMPFGWSCCFAHLTQICPYAIDYALKTRSTNDSFVEAGGGYFYPDRFGMARSNRWELLAEHTRQTWARMKKTNSRLLSFNFSQCDSPDARRACQVIADQTDGLLAILAFQYYPYEGGAGKVYWVRDSNGLDVPIITARYSIWEHSNQRDRSGTPAKIAREIQQAIAGAGDQPRYDWVSVHAWSAFKQAPGVDEEAENMPQEHAEDHGGARGFAPALWCGQRLPSSIRVITPEEMALRIRMAHSPAQTALFLRAAP